MLVGKKEDVIELQEGATVSDFLDSLARKYGSKFESAIFYSKTRNVYALVLINGQDFRSLGRLHAKLNEGDSVSILPPVSGG